MAIRTKKINFQEFSVDDSNYLADVTDIGDAAQILERNDDGVYQVITAEEAKKKKLSELGDILINQTAIEKGGVKDSYLMKDLTLIKKHFMEEFSDLNTREIVLDDELNWVKFINFPMPDYFINANGIKKCYTPDFEDIVIVINEYPENGPFGIHIKKGSPNKARIQEVLGGHIYNEVLGNSIHAEKVSELKEKGWDWVCFHYVKGRKWNFNRNDLRKGDCLATYIENLFAALSGAYSNV